MPLTCKICHSNLSYAFNAIVLGKHDARYNYCEECGFLSAENPYWLDDAYSCAIASTDTGLVSRNIVIANKLAIVLYFLMGERGKGRYVDVAGGYGMLTRLMRDYGFDFYWSDKYCQNLMARGFDYSPELGSCCAVTAFEVLEHTEDPISFIESALTYGNTETLIFSTELYKGNPPPPDHWRYYSFETGQHISFFQQKTLAVLASKLGLSHCSHGWLHILSKNKLDKVLLRAYTGRLGFLTFRWLRKHLDSLTMSDHNALVRSISAERNP
jgi:methyltransferase family protein